MTSQTIHKLTIESQNDEQGRPRTFMRVEFQDGRVVHHVVTMPYDEMTVPGMVMNLHRQADYLQSWAQADAQLPKSFF